MTTTATKTIFLSKKGLKELRKTITRLEHEQSRTLSELRELDKSSSHDERLAHIEKLMTLEGIENELAEKRELLVHAKQLPRKRDALKVAIGSVVDLIDQRGRLVRYTLVDSVEANPSDGRISVVSPLGSTLVGKTVKDVVEWSNGLRTHQFQLVKIT